MDNQLSRRKVMQLLAATMVGTSVLPLSGLACDNNEMQYNQGFVELKPVFIPPGAGKKGNIAVNEIVFKLNKE